MADERLVVAANHIYDTLIGELQAEGIPVPERRFVHVGLIAHDYAGTDCAEFFTLSWTNTFQGHLGGATEQAIRCTMPLTAQFTVALIRCAPTLSRSGKAPTEAQLHTFAETLMRDAWTLPAVVISSTVQGTLRQNRIDLVGIAGVQSFGPQGGVAGTELTMLATIL
jgi:hypothetical protein